jgi:hypothetical protein
MGGEDVKLMRDERGNIMVEFALVFYLYMAIIAMLIIHGLWLYNITQTERAARHAAVYLGTTNDVDKAEEVANEYLEKTLVLTRVENISVYWNGDSPAAQVHTAMKTFFPGISKLLNPENPGWVDEVQIEKVVTAPGEHRITHSNEYN